MPTIPQRIASAFAVLCGQYGDVTTMAQDREQSRQSLYREAERAVDAVDGTAAQARIDALQRQVAQQQAQVQALRERLERPWRSPPTNRTSSPPSPRPRGSACASPAGSCRSWRGRRLPSVPPLGRATLEAAGLRGPVARGARREGPAQVDQAAADEIFWAETGPDGGRAREPLLAHGPDG